MHATPECAMKSEVKCYEVKIKAGSCWESNPGQHLTCAARALPLSCDNQTTTSPHNPLYVLSGCQVCDWGISVPHVQYIYHTHLTLRAPFLPIRFSYKYREAYNSITVVSFIYMPPFLAVECARETAMAEMSVTVSCCLR